jgi:hypothetical protein
MREYLQPKLRPASELSFLKGLLFCRQITASDATVRPPVEKDSNIVYFASVSFVVGFRLFFISCAFRSLYPATARLPS